MTVRLWVTYPSRFSPGRIHLTSCRFAGHESTHGRFVVNPAELGTAVPCRVCLPYGCRMGQFDFDGVAARG